MKVICLSLLFLLFHVSSCSIDHTITGIAWGYNATTSFKVINDWIGYQLPLIQLYDGMCGDWIWWYPVPVWEQHGVPMLSYAPSSPNCSTTPRNVAEQFANGAYDSILKSFINKTKTFLSGPNGIYGDDDDRRMFFRFAWEMNGNWYEWSGNTTAYNLMWIHFWTLFQNAGVNNTRMQWVWCPAAQDSVSSLLAEHYYPGDKYVDWIAMDGYNDAHSQSWSTWVTPTQVFGAMTKRLNVLAPNKPLGIAEVGCSTAGYTTTDKATWITQLYQFVLQFSIRFVMWFNDEGGYPDYGVFSSRNGTSNYTSPDTNRSYYIFQEYATQAVKTTIPLQPNLSSILTDDQFFGNFS